jgi:hypothetical protein
MRRLSTTILALATITLVSAPAAHAQTIGFKLGASLANWSADDLDNTNLNSITGFAGGGHIRFGMGRLGIQLELLSITKGTEFEDLSGDDDGKIGIEYVEIPLLLHVPLSLGSITPYVFGGPSLAFEVSCSVEEGGLDVDCDDPAGDIIGRSSTDFGVSAGGGLGFPVGPGNLFVEGRYTWGLKNLNDSDVGPEVKNKGALIMAGYEISLGRR